jgi:hypothetical protein
MADTERSLAALQTLLADNSSGDISAQDLRDFLVSCFSAYGSIYVQDGATAQTSIGTTATLLTGFAANGESSGVTPNHADDELNIGVDGAYLATGCFSFSGTASRTFQLRLRKSGSEVAGIGCRVTLDASGNTTSASFVGIVACEADDILTVYVEADAADSSLTLIDAALGVKRVG